MAGYADVRVVSVHAGCVLCGDCANIAVNTGDAFTRQVLMPMASWWEAHRAPRLVALLLSVDGVREEWFHT